MAAYSVGEVADSEREMVAGRVPEVEPHKEVGFGVGYAGAGW